MTRAMAAILIFFTLGPQANAVERSCALASEQAKYAWQVYVSEIDGKFREVAGQRQVDWRLYDALKRREFFAKEATHQANYALPSNLGAAWAVPRDDGSRYYDAAMQASETGWRVCHPGAVSPTRPPHQHPLIARVWRRLFAMLEGANRDRLLAIDTSYTDHGDAARIARIESETALRRLAPWLLDLAGDRTYAARLLVLPPIVDAKSLPAVRQALLSIKKELYASAVPGQGVRDYYEFEKKLGYVAGAIGDGTHAENADFEYLFDSLAILAQTRSGPRYDQAVAVALDMLREMTQAARMPD